MPRTPTAAAGGRAVGQTGIDVAFAGYGSAAACRLLWPRSRSPPAGSLPGGAGYANLCRVITGHLALSERAFFAGRAAAGRAQGAAAGASAP